MSELLLENYEEPLALTVRVKLVDLNHPGVPRLSASGYAAEQHAGAAMTVSNSGPLSDRSAGGNSTETAPGDTRALNGEICIATGYRIPSGSFESHIEECTSCSNRVELQLDFIETLETAIYQRQAEPKSRKISGALLVSAPLMNFAICGELER